MAASSNGANAADESAQAPAGQLDLGNLTSLVGSSPAEVLALAWQTALDQLQAAFASVPGIEGDQLAPLHDALDQIVSILQSIGDTLTHLADGSARDESARTASASLLSASDPSAAGDSSPTGGLGSSASDNLDRATTFLSDLVQSATGGASDSSWSSSSLPFVFGDVLGQYGLADLIAAHASAVSAAEQYATELWANLLDVYRPSASAALTANDPGAASTASVLAASSLAQSPTGA